MLWIPQKIIVNAVEEMSFLWVFSLDHSKINLAVFPDNYTMNQHCVASLWSSDWG